mmetsp:Transcript_100358/g.299501  ORF Transcript_100358/g.299501 Transcript_100358/m.299501 type:complete len:93 (-) Transcript_100358:306-584(-)
MDSSGGTGRPSIEVIAPDVRGAGAVELDVVTLLASTHCTPAGVDMITIFGGACRTAEPDDCVETVRSKMDCPGAADATAAVGDDSGVWENRL